MLQCRHQVWNQFVLDFLNHLLLGYSFFLLAYWVKSHMIAKNIQYGVRQTGEFASKPDCIDEKKSTSLLRLRQVMVNICKWCWLSEMWYIFNERPMIWHNIARLILKAKNRFRKMFNNWTSAWGELEILCKESLWVGFRFLKYRLKIHVVPKVFRFDQFWP